MHTKIVFSVDGVVHYTYNPGVKDASTWPFNADQYLLINFAIQSSIFPEFTQDAMQIDYVRIYQSTALSAIKSTKDTGLKVFPNPVKDTLYVSLYSGFNNGVMVQINDISGRVVFKEAYTQGKRNLEINTFPQILIFNKNTIMSTIKHKKFSSNIVTKY